MVVPGQKDRKGWATPIFSVYISLLLLEVLCGVWKYRKEGRKGKEGGKER